MAINIQVEAGERAQVFANFKSNIDKDTASGREQLLAGGQNEFRGYSKGAVAKFLQVSLEVDARSHYDFWRRVVRPLTDISAKLQESGLAVPAIYAGEQDIPPHFTYTRAITDSAEETEKAKIGLLLNPDMQEVLGMLPGIEFTMDTLVLGNASYVCTRRPSDLVIGTRRVINDLVALKHPDFKVISYNLAQASSKRIVSPMSSSAGEALLNESAALKAGLEADPVILRVSEVFFGSAADHIKGHRKNLLLAA